MAAIYECHARTVFDYARCTLARRAVADDVVQEVFLELWQRPERFDPDRGSLRTYLLMLAHARSVDVVRSESARRRREEREGLRAIRSSEGNENRQAEADEVHSALAGLSPEQREAIALAYFLGYTYREVAAHLGVPEGTIKNRIRKGLGLLRTELAETSRESSSARNDPDGTRELLGAYALDAVDADERAQVEALVAVDDGARAELDGLQHATAVLHDDRGPSDAVWSRIEQAMREGEPAAPAEPTSLAQHRWRRRAVRVGVAVVAVAALVALALWSDGRFTSQSIPTQPASELRHAAQLAAGQPGSRRVELISNDHRTHLEVLVAADGRAFLLGGTIGAAKPGRTLVLFATTATQTVLVHEVGPRLHLVEFELPGGALSLVLGETAGAGHPAVHLAQSSLAPVCDGACPGTSPSPPSSGTPSGSPPAGGSPAPAPPAPAGSPTPSSRPGSGLGGGGLLPPITLPPLPRLPAL